MKSLYLATMVMTMAVAACDDPDEGGQFSAEAAALIGGCEVLRPVSWNVNGTTCLEDEGGTIILPVGRDYIATSYGGGVFGTGQARLRCVAEGDLRIISRGCKPFNGTPP